MPAGSFELNTLRGIQDEGLTGNPDVSFFKCVYKRHTNFALETYSYTLQGAAFGRDCKQLVTRDGPLLLDSYIEIVLSNTKTHCYGLGNALLKYIELRIGGQCVERISGQMLNVIGEIKKGCKRRTWDKLVGNIPGDEPVNKLIIPLAFFYSRNRAKLCLPLIGIQYQEVEIIIRFEKKENLLLPDDCIIESCVIYHEFACLDQSEQRQAFTNYEQVVEFAGYRTEQIEITDMANDIIMMDYIRNHPVSQLFFSVMPASSRQPCQSLCLHDNLNSTCIISYNSTVNEAISLEQLINYNTYKHNNNSPREDRIISPATYSIPPTLNSKPTPSFCSLLLAGSPAREKGGGREISESVVPLHWDCNPVQTVLEDVETPPDNHAGNSTDEEDDEPISDCLKNLGAAYRSHSILSPPQAFVLFCLPARRQEKREVGENWVEQQCPENLNLGLTTQCKRYRQYELGKNRHNQYIYTISYSLYPDDTTQPSGTLNYSRIDKCEIQLKNTKLAPGNYTMCMYWFYRDVLRVQNSYAGLAYSWN